MKGGYQIIDFKERNLTGNSVIIPGVYESIEGNYYKPILLSGLVIDGIERSSVFAIPQIIGGNYEFFVYDERITITSEDSVSLMSNPS